MCSRLRFHYAENGFPVGEVVSVYWRDSEDALKADERHGARLSSSAAARPQPAKCSRIPISPGPIGRSQRRARRVLQGRDREEDSRDRGRARRHDEGAPISPNINPNGSIRSRPPIAAGRVYELPPNGQGIAALEMLNIMERFPLAQMGHNSASALHAMIEARRSPTRT